MSTKVIGNGSTVAGSRIGSMIGGPIGGAIGAFIGNYAGEKLINTFGITNSNGSKKGHHLSNLAVQSSAYGEAIPILYGTTRLAGNVIWAQDIKEVANRTQNNSGGKSGLKQNSAKGDVYYSYYATLAIAMCEGPINEILRIWADTKLINISDYNIKIYKGTETQMPDSLIESIKGIGNTPAYRGLAYVVIEDFPLADYGNRIPNFTFEVKRNVLQKEETTAENLIESIVLIPGAGEFVYDDIVQNKIRGEESGGKWVQFGNSTRINQNNNAGKADGILALDQLAATCPNVKWVAPVVCWFGDSLNINECNIKPAVEYKDGATTSPDSWMVANYTRKNARQITLKGSRPQYGGTPSDASMLRYLQALKKRGYKILFYPMFFMDIDNKPWRGRVSGAENDIHEFFSRTEGYNNFIIHYAKLVKDIADAFIIGSELKGLTGIKDSNNNFPAVNELILLARQVKEILGKDVKVTYAADWSEYHHTDGGWYNLDPLWASPDIDVVGIDAYFPLTDAPEPSAGFKDIELQNGWDSGEGYDWYYENQERSIKKTLSPAYAWKNISWWWHNEHINPDGKKTPWVPASKKIWFTEYGFPSVDGASNQPNVFYDPTSQESAFPYHSRGHVDFRAQRNAITATEKKWAASDMVERKFVWCWDARPFPFWPDLEEIWADGKMWRFGHWLQGKIGTSNLAAVIHDLSLRSGLTKENIDTNSITDMLDGYVLKGQGSIREALDILRHAYFFDVVESDSTIKFVKRGNSSFINIDTQNLVVSDKEEPVCNITRTQELELPQKINVLYFDKSTNYQTGNQQSSRQVVNSQDAKTISLPLVMTDQQAKNISDITLFNAWQERNSYQFTLPLSYAFIEPTDIISITKDKQNHVIRVTDTRLLAPGVLRITGACEDPNIYNFYNEPGKSTPHTNIISPPGTTKLAILDLPFLPYETNATPGIYYAACGEEDAWKGAAIYSSKNNGETYTQTAIINIAATMGTCLNKIDSENTAIIALLGNGELESKNNPAILNGENLAKIGDEILQFETAELISENKYLLQGLLRGLLGTEWAVSKHQPGEEFILLNNALVKEEKPRSSIGIPLLYKAISIGTNNTENETIYEFTYKANCLKPFSPVNINFIKDEGNNITITWVRRTHTDGVQNYSDVSPGEEKEEYEVEIIDGETLLRTIKSIPCPSLVYSIEQQIEDFGSKADSFNIKIYQISTITGRGDAGMAVFKNLL